MTPKSEEASARLEPPEAMDTGGSAPMSHEVSHGAATRRPVYAGKTRVPGLFERTRADGSVAFEVSARLGGRMRRHTLTAHTKSDAIRELRELLVDYQRGEQHRSAAAALTVRELAEDWI